MPARARATAATFDVASSLRPPGSFRLPICRTIQSSSRPISLTIQTSCMGSYVRNQTVETVKHFARDGLERPSYRILMQLQREITANPASNGVDSSSSELLRPRRPCVGGPMTEGYPNALSRAYPPFPDLARLRRARSGNGGGGFPAHVANQSWLPLTQGRRRH